jgi:cyanate permease
MLAATVGVSAGFTLFLAHGVTHLKDLGHSMTEGATAVSILTISTLLAKTIVAALGDRMDPRYLWAGFTLVFGVGLLLVVHATGPMDIYPFAICLGSGFGGMLVCQMAVLANYFGSKAYASVVGLALAVQTAVGASSPYIVGGLYDTSHTYAPSFRFLAAVCLVGAAILFAIRPPLRRAPMGAAADASRGSSAGAASTGA